MPAIALCSGLLIIGFQQKQTKPLLAFAILFFFLNHLVESSFLALELIFEHRNLLPSLFLFFPVAAWLVKTINQNTKMKKWYSSLLLLACTGFLIQSGLATHSRNKDWRTSESLIRDAANKAPLSGRAKLNLAGILLQKGQYQEALTLCDQAEKLTGMTKNKLKPMALAMKGSIAYELGDFDKALHSLNKAYSLRKDYTAAAEQLIALLIEMEHYEEALQIISERYTLTGEPNLLLTRGSILLRQQKPLESLYVYHKAHRFYPMSTLINAGQGKALSLLGYHNRANLILNWAEKNNTKEARFLRIENYLRAGETRQANAILQQLIKTVPLQKLLEGIENRQNDAFRIPLDRVLIKQALFEVIQSLQPTSLLQTKTAANHTTKQLYLTRND
jgi:tetratricopeptide (TPR) repeat protein